MSWFEEQEETMTYKVVMNHEEQYSLWPADRENPLGWHDAGKSGSKQECLEYVKNVWTDMRPLSLRQQMAEAAQRQTQASARPPATEPAPRDDLLERLCAGTHPVEAVVRPGNDARTLKERIDMGYVYIKFINTRGGTELGVRLDASALDLSQADFAQPAGTVHLVGDLTLNYVKVRCIADLDLTTLSGQGYLVPVAA